MSPARSVVYVVDDDTSMREGLSSLIRSVGLDVRVFASADAFLAYGLPDLPSCLILDVRLPGLGGLELQQRLEGRVPIIFITGHGDIPMSVRAIKAGAVEFLTKPFHDGDLLRAVRSSLQMDASARQQSEIDARLRSRYRQLTEREREVLRLVAQGQLNKQVAATLGISEATVKVHRRHLMEKLETGSITELLAVAEKLRALAEL